MNRKIIINADDCGISKFVNQEIERFIQLRKITSTSVIANMDDLSGAKSLFDLYKNDISFGVHINLTCGSPLTYSQLLIDYGYFIEDNGALLLNGYAFYYKTFSPRISKEIEKECVAQIKRVRDVGIEVSHIDSHHLLHTSPSMFFITPNVLNNSGIKKMRRPYHYYNQKTLSIYIRQLWNIWMKLQIKGYKCTDWFDGFSSFVNQYTEEIKMGGTIELMTHPGGNLPEEDDLIIKTDYKVFFKDFQLINYKQL